MRIEKHFAAGLIGMTTGNQFFDDVDHLGNVIGGTRLDCRLKIAECCNILMKLLGGLFRHRMDGIIEWQVRVITQRTRIDLVVNVSDVACIGNVVFTVDIPQYTIQHVEHDHRARIADMSKIIHGRAADIHAHVLFINRRKSSLFAGQGVVKFQVHFNFSRTEP
ncbi:hypothetical protein D3C80_1689640 [compost metagenome]